MVKPGLATALSQRAAFGKAQTDSIHNLLRLLESIVGSPIGLVTDLRSLREAMPAESASDERDRRAFHDISSSSAEARARLGLRAVSLANELMDLLKLSDSEDATSLPLEWTSRAVMVVDRIRYRLSADIRKERSSLMEGVYVIVDPDLTNGRPVLDITEAVLKGGACAIQLRDKGRGDRSTLADAGIIAGLCRENDSLFIVNDAPHIAKASNADGLHVGQNDMHIAAARRILSEEQIVGVSNATIQEALESESDSADYIAIGAIADTNSKPNTRFAGLETLEAVSGAVSVPVVAVGGINLSNVREVVTAGADAVCVISAVTQADDPEATVRRMSESFS